MAILVSAKGTAENHTHPLLKSCDLLPNNINHFLNSKNIKYTSKKLCPKSQLMIMAPICDDTIDESLWLMEVDVC